MGTIQFRPATPKDDVISVGHLMKLARELSFSEADIEPNAFTISLDWIAQARRLDRYQGFLAEVNHQIAGSIGCQLFQKPYPPIFQLSTTQYGYIWGLYVVPEYRRQGIATQLMQLAIDYLKSLHCTHVLLHASKFGQPLYERLDFTTSNEMCLTLNSKVE